jgi:hypothetical protein
MKIRLIYNRTMEKSLCGHLNIMETEIISSGHIRYAKRASEQRAAVANLTI